MPAAEVGLVDRDDAVSRCDDMRYRAGILQWDRGSPQSLSVVPAQVSETLVSFQSLSLISLLRRQG